MLGCDRATSDDNFMQPYLDASIFISFTFPNGFTILDEYRAPAERFRLVRQWQHDCCMAILQRNDQKAWHFAANDTLTTTQAVQAESEGGELRGATFEFVVVLLK